MLTDEQRVKLFKFWKGIEVIKTMQSIKKHLKLLQSVLFMRLKSLKGHNPTPTILSVKFDFQDYFLRLIGSNFTSKPDFDNQIFEFFNVHADLKMLNQIKFDRLIYLFLVYHNLKNLSSTFFTL